MQSCKEEATGTRYVVATSVTFSDLVAHLLLSRGTHEWCHVLEEIPSGDKAVPLTLAARTGSSMSAEVILKQYF